MDFSALSSPALLVRRKSVTGGTAMAAAFGGAGAACGMGGDSTCHTAGVSGLRVSVPPPANPARGDGFFSFSSGGVAVTMVGPTTPPPGASSTKAVASSPSPSPVAHHHRGVPASHYTNNVSPSPGYAASPSPSPPPTTDTSCGSQELVDRLGFSRRFRSVADAAARVRAELDLLAVQSLGTPHTLSSAQVAGVVPPPPPHTPLHTSASQRSVEGATRELARVGGGASVEVASQLERDASPVHSQTSRSDGGAGNKGGSKGAAGGGGGGSGGGSAGGGTGSTVATVGGGGAGGSDATSGPTLQVMFQRYTPGASTAPLATPPCSLAALGGAAVASAPSGLRVTPPLVGAGGAGAGGALGPMAAQSLNVMNAAVQLAGDQLAVIRKLDRTVQLLYSRLEKVRERHARAHGGACVGGGWRSGAGHCGASVGEAQCLATSLPPALRVPAGRPPVSLTWLRACMSCGDAS
jgi:hypothetical protein